MNAEQLKLLLEHWTRLLGISDWTLEVRTCQPHEMPEGFGHCMGACRNNPESRRAEISLAFPATLGDRSLSCNECDVEATLVHELVHVVLDDAGVKPDEQPERLVFTLERALTASGRLGPKIDLDPFSVDRIHLRYEPWLSNWVDLLEGER